MKTIIIVGSARKNGDTHIVADQIAKEVDGDVIDLLDYQISHFDYNHANSDDEFIALMQKLIKNHGTLIFATPVYWYAMSGIMKVFFDRLTDVITIEKDLGRRLKGKKMAVLTSSNGNHLGDNFWLPFINTADYLCMEYLGNLHTLSGQDNEVLIKEFTKQYL